MSPLDRIAQLTSQLADAREQAARDSATIARLTAERQNWKEWAEEARASTNEGQAKALEWLAGSGMIVPSDMAPLHAAIRQLRSA